MADLFFQCLLGIQCQDFTMIAADQINTHQVIIMKDDADKLYEVSDRLVLGVNGDTGETAQFTQFVAKNLQLYKMKNKYQLGTSAVVHFIKKTMSDRLHNSNPCILNLLVGGYDDNAGGQLYIMDFLAACVKVPYAAHGIGGYLSLGILDHYYRPNLTVPEAYEILKICVREVNQRLFMNLPSFRVKIITKDGIKTLPSIHPAMLVNK